MNSSSARVKTLPVGLLGVFRMMALVRGPKARGQFPFVESVQSGGRIFTKRGVAPDKIASGP